MFAGIVRCGCYLTFTEQWHEALPDPTIADAILDRVIHSAHRIKLTGESMRKILAKPEQKELNNG
jgi:DNA replication protein DnaC